MPSFDFSDNWKNIPNFPHYKISKNGEVRRIADVITNIYGVKHNVRERILKQNLDNYGYLYVTLTEKGKPTKIAVHRLVAMTFIPNSNNYTCVNHKDKNIKNNNVDNLEWCNHSYNANYSINEIRLSHLKECQSVIRIDKFTGETKTYISVREAAKENNTFHSNIIKAIKRNGSCAGYKWAFI